jgi:hypothetical protein
MSDSEYESRASRETQDNREKRKSSLEDLTNAEAFQLFSTKLDAALEQNKQQFIQELEARKLHGTLDKRSEVEPRF